MAIKGRGQAVANTNKELLESKERTVTETVWAENTYNLGGAFIIDVTEAGVRQVETATLIGTITGDGDVDVVITAAGMNNSPKTLKAPVIIDDEDFDVADIIREVLNNDADVTALFTVSGQGDAVILTKIVAGANDATLNIATANDTSTGLTAAPSSANTTAGGATIDVTPKIEAYDPVSGKYYPILTGIAITAVGTTVLKVHPLLTASANVIAEDMLPKNYRFTMTHGDALVTVYSVAINGNN